ncbi:MAG: hypothetical protein ABIF08_03055 [Nanoarchaeota archaeon]
MSVFMCQICKEPVTSFMCPNRLAVSIRDWLPSGFVDNFVRMHNTLLVHFSKDSCDFEHQHSQCGSRNIICGGKNRVSICAFCYIAEVYDWLKNKNTVLADQFLHVFSLGYKKIRFKLDRKIIREPILDTITWKTDSGICDECGEYSDELKLQRKEWVCEACSHGD